MYIKQQLFYPNLVDRQKFLTKKYNHLSRQLTTRLVSVNADFGDNLVYINQRSHVLSRRGLQLKYLLEEKLRSIKMKTQNTELNQILGHYKILRPDVQLILDNEKYFALNGDISCNRKYYTTDRSTAPPEVKFKTKMKFEPKLLVWMAVSQKGISSIYVHRSTIAIKQETYLHDCIRKRLFPFINRHHKNDNVLFWPDLASSHYSK